MQTDIKISEDSSLSQELPLEGGFFGFGNTSFKGVINQTRNSESTLIKNYENMESSTKKYNESYKKHLENLTKLDDYAGFNGMKNLFKKVILKDNFRQGNVDKGLPILFRNYRILEEPSPKAFRREHILRQIDYIMDTSFAGREHMLIKNMSVDVGKHEFVLNITTIENVKKKRTIEHHDYIIDNAKTRAEIKDILASTKKNLKRKTMVVEIGSKSSSSKSSSSSSRSKSKSKSKSTSRSRTKKSQSRSRTRKHKTSTSDPSSLSGNKSMTLRTSNTLPSNMNMATKKPLDSYKEPKLSMYMRPSEKQVKAAVASLPISGTVAQPAMPVQFAQALPPPNFAAPVTATVEQRKADLLQMQPTQFQAPISQPPQIPTGYNGVAANTTAATAPTSQCNQLYDQQSCKNAGCYWNFKGNFCKVDTRGPGGPGGPAGPRFGFGGLQPMPPPQGAAMPQQVAQPAQPIGGLNTPGAAPIMI